MSFDRLSFVGPYFALHHVILSFVIYKAVVCFSSLWLYDVSFVGPYFALHPCGCMMCHLKGHILLYIMSFYRLSFVGSHFAVQGEQRVPLRKPFLPHADIFLFIITLSTPGYCRPVLINKRIQSYCVGLILNSLHYLIIIILTLMFILRNIKTTNFATFIGNST